MYVKDNATVHRLLTQTYHHNNNFNLILLSIFIFLSLCDIKSLLLVSFCRCDLFKEWQKRGRGKKFALNSSSFRSALLVSTPLHHSLYVFEDSLPHFKVYLFSLSLSSMNCHLNAISHSTWNVYEKTDLQKNPLLI